VGSYLEYDPDYRYFYAGDAFPGPLSYKGAADVLYMNKGDGTFEDVTRKSGVFNPNGRAMGVSSCDINDDGYPDIFVANDAMENYLYRNNGNGTFTDIAFLSGTGFSQNGEATSAMSPEFGYFDGDEMVDILVPDMDYGCLYINSGKEFFSEISARSGLAAICGQYTSWSGKFLDIENNGTLDIMLTNGDTHFYEPEEDLILRNLGNKRIENISDKLGRDFQNKSMGRGSAIGDIDNDGDLDILITNLNSSPKLYRNDGRNQNHWLMISVTGSKSNKDGIGTRIRLTSQKKTQVRDVMSSSGYLSQSDSRVHFGLGDSDKIDEIEFRWPNGKTTSLKNVSVDQILFVTEPE